MTVIAIIPAPDRRAYHEDGRLLAVDGETVANSTWWRRRLADGDVLLAPRGAGSVSKKRTPA